MTIHKEGYRILLITIVLLGIANISLRWAVSLHPQIDLFTIILSSFMVLFVLAFFRKPIRTFPITDTGAVVSPADGKVVTIEEVEEPEYFNEKKLLISIFMSPSNVHINWNPLSGVVKYVKYHPGKYLVAYNPKSSTDNERNTIVIEGSKGTEVLIRQIAGFFARRIVHYVEVGKPVDQGKELGFIKFGSRVDVYLPLNAEVNVSLKEKVKGGKTQLARFS